MDWRDATKIRLLADFDGSFFNEREEFIAHRYSNTYFIFSNCESFINILSEEINQERCKK